MKNQLLILINLLLLSCAQTPTSSDPLIVKTVELRELKIGDCFISVDKLTSFLDPDQGFIYEFKVRDEYGVNAYLVVDIFHPTEGYIPGKDLKVIKTNCSVFEKIKAQDPTYGNEYKMLMKRAK